MKHFMTKLGLSLLTIACTFAITSCGDDDNTEALDPTPENPATSTDPLIGIWEDLDETDDDGAYLWVFNENKTVNIHDFYMGDYYRYTHQYYYDPTYNIIIVAFHGTDVEAFDVTKCTDKNLIMTFIDYRFDGTEIQGNFEVWCKNAIAKMLKDGYKSVTEETYYFTRSTQSRLDALIAQYTKAN